MIPEITIYLARFWGSLFIILGLLSLKGFLGKTIERSGDKLFTISTGYITMLLGLVTVILHNIWIMDWSLVITLLGWTTLIKGILKMGFPEHVHKQAQMFKKKQIFSSIFMFLLGIFLILMSFINN